jgi:hypothetical protein
VAELPAFGTTGPMARYAALGPPWRWRLAWRA